jgi:hypothetical protein
MTSTSLNLDFLIKLVSSKASALELALDVVSRLWEGGPSGVDYPPLDGYELDIHASYSTPNMVISTNSQSSQQRAGLTAPLAPAIFAVT